LSLQLVGSTGETGGWGVAGTNYLGMSILHMLSFSAVSSNVQIHPFRPPQVTLQVTAGIRFTAKNFWSIRPSRAALINFSTGLEPVLGGPACRKTEKSGARVYMQLKLVALAVGGR
jgi:hypothetical protein